MQSNLCNCSLHAVVNTHNTYVCIHMCLSINVWQQYDACMLVRTYITCSSNFKSHESMIIIIYLSHVKQGWYRKEIYCCISWCCVIYMYVPPFSFHQVVVACICLFIILPLHLVGTILGRNLAGKPDNPCRVNTVPRPLPEKKWLFSILLFRS